MVLVITYYNLFGEKLSKECGNYEINQSKKDWEQCWDHFTKFSWLKNGDTIQVEKKENLFILATTPTAKEHDRKLIEDSFKDFESHLITQAEVFPIVQEYVCDSQRSNASENENDN